jgi:hypothetical protein
MIASLRGLISRAQPWPDRLARAGFVAKGSVYLAVGGLAMAAAVGLRGQATDPVGALADAATTAIGRSLIGAIGLGLIAHALFRAALAVVGEPYGAQTLLRRVGRRISNAASTLCYVALGATAMALAVGWKSSGRTNDDATAQHWTAFALHAPLGRSVLIIVAVALTVAAIAQIVRAAWPHSVQRRLQMETMSAREQAIVGVVGRLAFLSRASVLLTISYFLWKGAILRAPGDVRGPGGALHAFWEAPHGNVLLAVVAGGLLAVGAFALIEARWRRLFNKTFSS